MEMPTKDILEIDPIVFEQTSDKRRKSWSLNTNTQWNEMHMA